MKRTINNIKRILRKSMILTLVFAISFLTIIPAQRILAYGGPDAPGYVVGEPVGDGKVAVSFIGPRDDGGSPIIEYVVMSQPGGVAATGTDSPIIVSGLQNDRAYKFTVKATNVYGTGPYSVESYYVWVAKNVVDFTSVTVTAPVAGAKPNYVALSGDTSKYTAKVTDWSDGGTADKPGTLMSSSSTFVGGNTYIVSVEIKPNPGYALKKDISINGNSSKTYFSVMQTTTGTMVFRMAFTATGTTVTKPSMPTKVDAKPAGDGKATVTFTAPNDGGSPITKYTVKSEPDGITATGTGSPITISGLKNDKAYRFTVTATNAVGTSATSNPSNYKWISNNLLDSALIKVVGPVAGAKPYYTAVSSDPSKYTAKIIEWYKDSSMYSKGNKMSSSETFVAGNTYRVDISVTPKKGYTFLYDPVIDGYSSATCNVINSYDGEEGCFYMFQATDSKVTLKANGGGYCTDYVFAKFGKAMPEAIMPKRTGAIFRGFFDTTASAGGKQYYDSSGNSVRNWDRTENATLYARWADGTPKTYTVTLNANGGIGGTASVVVTSGDSLPRLGDSSYPLLKGHDFNGYWDTKAATGGTQYYSSTGVSVKNWDKEANATLYARWKPYIYSVTVINGIGSGSYELSSTVTITANPAPTGKTFDKWVAKSGVVSFYNASSSTTQFDVRIGDPIEVEATYKDLSSGAKAIDIITDGNGIATANVTAAKKGDIVTLSATPTYDYYKFKEWQVIEGGVKVSDNKFTMGETSVKIKAVFELKNYKLKVVGGKDITGDGYYDVNSLVTIMADSAPTGKTFDKWTASSAVSFVDSENSATSTIRMPNKDVAFTATYKDVAPSEYDVNITTGGNGTAKANLKTASSGDLIILSAYPNSGYVFKEWKAEGADITIKDNSFTMPKNAVTVKAIFESVPTYKVTVKDGKVDKTNAIAGELVTVTANMAPDGKTFDKWTTSGGVTLANANAFSTTFKMPNKDVTITANYKTLSTGKYSINITNDGNGKANANVTEAKAGDVITLTAQPTEGYIFKNWIVVSGGSIDIKNNKFTMPAEKVIIDAIFAPLLVYEIKVIGGTSNKATATVGELVQIKANKAPDGTKFVRFIPSAGVTLFDTNSMSTSFYMPSKNVTIESEYGGLPEEEKVINIKGGEGGSITSDLSAKTGDKVELIPVSDPGYKFLGFIVDGKLVQDTEFTMPDDGLDIEAVFAPYFGESNLYGLNDFLAQWWWLLLLVFVLGNPIGLGIRKYVVMPKRNNKLKGAN